ncbi:MAG: altronate dehydratase family protein [Synergistaceae bacterium]|nr:altronate dehydratase family protein [Synergistaceae bacterium]
MKIIIINPADNVAVALEPVSEGEIISAGEREFEAKNHISPGHKIALRDIPAGGEVVKYGYPIGRAVADISAGEIVHVHNLKTGLSGELEYVYKPRLTPPEPRTPGSFKGFRRGDGKAGIRNEIWIIPTVGCVNSIGQIIAAKARGLVRGTVDGIYSFSHPYGCSQLGADHENTKKALRGLINHPNAGAALVLGLGCENNTIEGMKAMLGHGDTERIKFLTCQDTEDEIESALKLLAELVSYAERFEREDIPTSELVVGLKCGGSDGLSGITANPLVGVFSDRLIAEGGTAILTEVPELFGAETILMNRCESREVFEKTVRLINDFKEYFISHGQPVHGNPSPGNKDGGITTLEDKSLGCTQKAGRATVTDVLKYGESAEKKGLNLLESPGNDLVSSTALAVSGAHLVLFTTGRGTPFGSPVPTLKISSNTPLAEKKRGWIDFDAGSVAAGADINSLGDDLYELVRDVASGKTQTKTEQFGIRDLAIFKNGVTL